MGFDVIPSMLKILKAVEYDVIRAADDAVPSQEAIASYFKNLDWPTVRETLRIIGERNIQPEDLIGFMDATRYYFNLRDLLRDVAGGLMNISVEEAEAYGIDLSLLGRMHSFDDLLRYPPLRRWFTDQLCQMENHLDIGLGVLREKKAMLVTRLMLRVGFVMPCQNFAKRWETA
jgi:hypothetical protein